MIQKMPEDNYSIVHKPGEKHCNAEGLSRRPNEKLEWREVEEELRGQIPEFKSIKKAPDGAQEDIYSGSSSEREDADVIAHTRNHIPREKL